MLATAAEEEDPFTTSYTTSSSVSDGGSDGSKAARKSTRAHNQLNGQEGESLEDHETQWISVSTALPKEEEEVSEACEAT